MSWTTDDYLDAEDNDLEWFESNPDRILRRRPAFPLETDLLSEFAKRPSSERVWALVLRSAPLSRLYYTDPEDFWDYGEPAVNDDYTLMQMCEEIVRKGACFIQAMPYDHTKFHIFRPPIGYLLKLKADLNDYRKHQRKTLTLQ